MDGCVSLPPAPPFSHPFSYFSSVFCYCLPLRGSVESHLIHMYAVSRHIYLSHGLTGLFWWNGKRFRLSQVLCRSLLWQRCQWWPDLSRGCTISGGKHFWNIWGFHHSFPLYKIRGNSNLEMPEQFKVFCTEQMEVCVAKISRWTPGLSINHVVLVQRRANPIKPPFHKNTQNFKCVFRYLSREKTILLK